MSEFRKYRLVSKLLDFYGVSAPPQGYVAMLKTDREEEREQDMNMSLDNVHHADDLEIARLAALSKDPSRFSILAKELALECPSDCARMLTLIRLLKRSSSSMGEGEGGELAWQRRIAKTIQIEQIDHQFGARDKRQAIKKDHQEESNSSDDEDDQLDQLAERLNRVQHRMGITSMSKSVPPIPTTPITTTAEMDSADDDDGKGREREREREKEKGGREKGKDEWHKLRPFKNDFEWRLGQFPLPVQEILIVEDLLYLLLGLEGRYICREGDGHHEGGMIKGTLGSKREWPVLLMDDSMNAAILQAIRSPLEAALCFGHLEDFIRERGMVFEGGRVAQSLAAAIEDLLKEFRQVVVLLEKKFVSGKLGLQQFCFHLMPYGRNLSILSQIIGIIQDGNLYGGAILRLLEQKVAEYCGDKTVCGLIEGLLDQAGRPFLGMLQGWLRDGTLDDPHQEFILRISEGRVEDRASLSSLTSNLTLLPSNVPLAFEPMQMRILQVGAYHGILHSYRAHDQGDQKEIAEDEQEDLRKSTLDPHSQQQELSYDPRSIARTVERAFAWVNGQMLQMLLTKDRLMGALRVCKRYYFVERCDILHSFLDATRKELSRPSTAASLDQLRTNWEIVQRSMALSGGNEDLERVECYLAPQTLSDQLLRIIGLDANSAENNVVDGNVQDRHVCKAGDLFSIRLHFDFPDSLIFNGENLAKYELIFRLVFRLVDLSRELGRPVRTWRAMPSAVSRIFHLLRRQMLHFTHNLHQYLAFEVFEPNWARLEASIPQASGIEAIMQLHVHFLDSCLRQALLTNAKLVQLIAGLLSYCGRLVMMVGDGDGIGENDGDDLGGDEERSKRLGSKARQEELNRQKDYHGGDLGARLTTLQASFTKYMRVLLEALQYYSARDCDYHLGNLFSRLDFNSFYYSTAFGG